jgi:TrmH family RNA methyltransferase
VQDPGNMGTLVRSAEAFGANGVLTTAGTVSAWNQKALRASVGSVFRVPVVGVTAEEMRRWLGRCCCMRRVDKDRQRWRWFDDSFNNRCCH